MSEKMVAHDWSLIRRARRKLVRSIAQVAARPHETPYYLKELGILATPSVRRLAACSNVYSGRRVFIIGNGPSLQVGDLDAIAQELSVASNGIFLTFPKTMFRPTYFTVEDPLVAEDRAEQINALDGLQKIVPLDLRKFIRPSSSTTYVNFKRQYAGFPRFTDDFIRQVFWGGTVTFLNLQLAYHLGAREIVLLGVDHNYAKPSGSDKVEGAVITSQTEDRNHFDASYFGPGYRWHDPRMDRMEEAYWGARRFLEQKGVRVVNATRGGKLDVFPRVDFDELLSSIHKERGAA